MFFCAISGEPPQEPVLSLKSKKLYERRLILKYISENGADPITGDKLEEADLIAIEADPAVVAPRPPSHTSIPSLLHSLQNEWDALVLEVFTLKQQYNSTRQELSYALYAQDAASRVVARLIRERDAAREALANVQATIGVTSSTATKDIEMTEDEDTGDGLPALVLQKIDETHQVLSSARKKRKTPSGYPSPSEMKEYNSKHTISSLHSPSPAGITTLALSRTNSSQFLTGGNDKIVQLYDRSTDKVLASLKGHTKKINHVAFRERDGDPTLLLSAGSDKIAKIWSYDEASQEYIPKSTLRNHKGELTGLEIHPISTLLILSSADKTYSFHDLSNFTQIYRSNPADEPLTSLSIHPDGTLLAVGTSTSTIQIFDVRSGAIAASLSPPEGTPFTVNTLSFSENGYHLAGPNSLSSVAVWDLRKQKVASTIPLGDDFKINKVVYDASAQFLAVGGTQGARIFAYKSWEELNRFEEGNEVVDLAFGEQGVDIWGAVGREIRIWGS